MFSIVWIGTMMAGVLGSDDVFKQRWYALAATYGLPVAISFDIVWFLII